MAKDTLYGGLSSLRKCEGRNTMPLDAAEDLTPFEIHGTTHSMTNAEEGGMNSEATYCPQQFLEVNVTTPQQNDFASGVGAIFYS